MQLITLCDFAEAIDKAFKRIANLEEVVAIHEKKRMLSESDFFSDVRDTSLNEGKKVSEHVCGVQGFDQMRGDSCSRCDELRNTSQNKMNIFEKLKVWAMQRQVETKSLMRSEEHKGSDRWACYFDGKSDAFAEIIKWIEHLPPQSNDQKI